MRTVMGSGNLNQQPINLARLHWPVTSLGYGRRIGIWFQGCSIRCKGCCAQDTWHADKSSEVSLETVLEWMASKPMNEVDGFTISGGEPFDQSGALSELVKALQDRYCAERDRDVLVYSGYPWRTLKRKYGKVISHMDVVISEPFVSTRPGAWLRGSNNQKIHLLSELAYVRYGSGPYDSDRAPRMQVHYDGQTLWMIGIPRRGDLARIEERLGASGITLGAVSWRG